MEPPHSHLECDDGLVEPGMADCYHRVLGQGQLHSLILVVAGIEIHGILQRYQGLHDDGTWCGWVGGCVQGGRGLGA